jgi:hypothetical protein
MAAMATEPSLHQAKEEAACPRTSYRLAALVSIVVFALLCVLYQPGADA